MDDENQFKVTVEVPFPNHHLAEVAYHSLRVDAEPKRSGVTKVLILKDHVLETIFTGAQAKHLRVAINGFFENISLIADTAEFAGDPISEQYDHFY